MELPSAAPIGIWVGSYSVKPGDATETREQFDIQLSLGDDLYSDQGVLSTTTSWTLPSSVTRRAPGCYAPGDDSKRAPLYRFRGVAVAMPLHCADQTADPGDGMTN